MRVVVLVFVFMAVATVLFQNRAYWQFYSGSDCIDANKIGLGLEPVNPSDMRLSIACTNMESAGQSYKMDMGQFSISQAQFGSDWIATLYTTSTSRCASDDHAWDFYAAKRGVCIQYAYSDGIPVSFVMTGCNSVNPWDDPSLGEIVVGYNFNGWDCAAGTVSFPFLLEPIQAGQLICVESSPDAAAAAYAGYCPASLIDPTPVATPSAATPSGNTPSVNTPVATPMTIPASSPSIVVPVAPTSSPSRVPSISAIIAVQIMSIILGLTFSL